MYLWIDAILIVLVALLIDRFIGELPNRYHLLRWIGNVVDFLDKRIMRGSSRSTKIKGALSYFFVFLIFWIVMMFITSIIRNALMEPSWEIAGMTISLGELIWIFALAFMFKITYAIFSFRKHCIPIEKDLLENDVESARKKVQMIVSRDTSDMDEKHIASSCCETISENLVDSVLSPTFYFGLFGLTGAIMFRCANLMDAMWGYLNDKYRDLGFFVAKFDDVLGYITSRISPIFVALAAKISNCTSKGVIKAARAEHGKTPSPNSGWSMSAVAASMGIIMEKKDVYVMGEGDMPTVKDISRCYKLVERSSIIFLLIIAMPLFAILGVHIQVTIEDWLFGLIEMII